MAFQTFLLYLAPSLAGLVMVAGGIFLIYKEKIYLDHETKEVISIETPMGKFKTNIPALALFVLGFVPLIYPLYQAKSVSQLRSETAEIKGTLSADQPINVYAVAVQCGLQKSRELREYRLDVPSSRATHYYTVLYVTGNQILDQHSADVKDAKNGIIQLPSKEFTLGNVRSFDSPGTPSAADGIDGSIRVAGAK